MLIKFNSNKNHIIITICLLALTITILCANGYQKSDQHYEIIAETFSQVDSLLKIDNGNFWNHQLYGPILIADPETFALICVI